MPTASESQQIESAPQQTSRRLYRSNTDRVVAGIGGGVGEYFDIDPIWVRIAFVLLTVGGGSGVLIYLIMWLIIPAAPDGYVPQRGAGGRLTGAAIIGLVLMTVGAIALVNTVLPSLGVYFWPFALVVGGLALVMGGLNRDNDR